jgi:hypothetical protein
VSNQADFRVVPHVVPLVPFGELTDACEFCPRAGVHTCHLAPDSLLLLLCAGFKVGELRLFGSARSAGREVDTKFGKVQSSPSFTIVICALDPDLGASS